MKNSERLYEFMISPGREGQTRTQFTNRVLKLINMCPSIVYQYYIKKTNKYYIGLLVKTDSEFGPDMNIRAFSSWVWNRLELLDENMGFRQDNVMRSELEDLNEIEPFDINNKNYYMHI